MQKYGVDVLYGTPRGDFLPRAYHPSRDPCLTDPVIVRPIVTPGLEFFIVTRRCHLNEVHSWATGCLDDFSKAEWLLHMTMLP